MGLAGVPGHEVEAECTDTKELEKSSVGITNETSVAMDAIGSGDNARGNVDVKESSKVQQSSRACWNSWTVHQSFPASPRTSFTIDLVHPSNLIRRIVQSPEGSPKVSQEAPRPHTFAASSLRNRQDTRMACLEWEAWSLARAESGSR